MRVPLTEPRHPERGASDEPGSALSQSFGTYSRGLPSSIFGSDLSRIGGDAERQVRQL